MSTETEMTGTNHSVGEKRTDTAERLLDAAQALVQARGFNGFSYADLSAEIGIRKASIHHHFPTKADLGQALVARYRQVFREQLEFIASETPDPRTRLERYLIAFADVLRDNGRMCLCGMLAADINTLPLPVRQEVRCFFEEGEKWLVAALEEGHQTGVFHFAGEAVEEARLLIATAEGAMLVTRLYPAEAVARFETMARRLIALLTFPTP